MYIVDRPHLQLNLNMLDLNLAIDIALATDDDIDIFAAGTSLIAYNGIAAVRRLTQQFAIKPVVADLKIVEDAEVEVAMARDVGASLVTVLAAAPFNTIKLAVKKAHDCGLRVIADMVGVQDLVAKVTELEHLSVDFILVRVPKQGRGEEARRFDDLQTVVGATRHTVGVTGNVQLGDMPFLRTIPNLGLVVVGDIVTSAAQPDTVAHHFRTSLDR